VVIASGFRPNVVLDVISGKLVGTLFSRRPAAPLADAELSPKASAEGARKGANALQALTTAERQLMLYACADALLKNAEEILAANASDMEAAKENQLDAHLLNRLELTQSKLETLALGMRQVADLDEPLNRVLRHSLVSEGLNLKQITAPLGVLLIIFESRPGVLAQVSSLALKTGNGLLLKGGSVAQHSNRVIHRVLTDAIHESTQGRVPKSVVSLVKDRQAVSSLLKLHQHIDLIIPRGSNALVSHIQKSTHIPVLGHADVCKGGGGGVIVTCCAMCVCICAHVCVCM
jgi:gamma-glutamyl phosphate reductase